MRLAFAVGLVSAMGLGLQSGYSATPAANGETELSRLIGQLGSQRFQEREESTKALDDLGPAALEALQKATRNEDAEIRRRAATLVRRIEKRLDTARILAPHKTRLSFRDVPVPQAVAEFSRKVNFPITIEGDLTRLRTRKITLETAEIPFWEAYEQFCQKAGLVDKYLAQFQTVPTAAFSAAQRALLEREIVARTANPYALAAGAADGRLVLVDGQAPSLPTSVTGAVRVRALPKNLAMPQGKVAGEASFTLDITPEPKMQWQGVLNLTVDSAVDDRGQVLAQKTAPMPNGLPSDLIAQGIAPNGMVVMGSSYAVAGATGIRQLPVRFKLEKEPSKQLKEVKGRITAQVRTAPQVLLAVNGILKAAGKKADGPDGLSVKVAQANKLANGGVTVKVQMEMPNQAGVNFWNARGRVFVRRQVLVNGNLVVQSEVIDGGNAGLALLDSKGASFRLVSTQQDAMNFNGTNLQQDLTLTFQPQQGQTEPAQLVYKGPRTVIIDVPFALKNVPLP